MLAAAGLVVLVAGASVFDSAGASVTAGAETFGVVVAEPSFELDPQAVSAINAAEIRTDFLDVNLFDIITDTS
ncbi:unannotated protein [freshwater metagenome]|uniref:Unannotated protein n=1 Tax=freshwater metagenome TaxID=449393 RepID=A0A6J7GP92_9ZZZZ